MPLEPLPDELTDWICGLCDLPSNKALRLTCSKMASGTSTGRACILRKALLVVDIDSPRPTLDSIVKDKIWPHLANFTICLVKTFLGHLVDFLLRHSETLKCVELGEIHLIEGKWPGCLSKLAGKLTKLQKFDVRGLFTQDWSEETDWTFYDFWATIS
jgi:hypothetical protein